MAGFRISRTVALPEIRGEAIEARHERTGARFLHLSIPEEDENLLSIAFRTPPADDTGLMHILEHSVLGGSRKFPVKDPFLEMLKSSVATFINAMTYPDHTVYPLASTVRKDFFNLADVYLDAVFQARISRTTLHQEGHHYEFVRPGDPQSPLTISGVVYNEMKGAYSDLDAVIHRTTSRHLFPTSAYGRDSGGDPERIPDLTYEAFREAYQYFYHPANSYLISCGNISTRDQMEFLDGHLRDLAPRRPIHTEIIPERRWSRPRRTEVPYPVGPDESVRRRTAVTLSWMVGETGDPLLDLAMSVLDLLLLGTSGAPLQRSLLESELGEDLVDSGYDGSALHGTFEIGLKGVETCNVDRVVALIESILKRVAREGFRAEQVETAFQQMQYTHNEIQTLYPLRLMEWVYNAWMYNRDPLLFLNVKQQLNTLYKRYRETPDLFANLVREHLLQNPHRLTAVFVPDPDLQQRKAEAFQQQMETLKATLDSSQKQRIAREAAELREIQNAPNPPEAVAALPSLQLEDLGRETQTIPHSVTSMGENASLIVNDVFANGINYLATAFDLRELPADLWPLMPVFSHLFTRIGTRRHDHAEMSEKIAACSGGLKASVNAATHIRDPSNTVPCFQLQFKALDARYSDVLEILRELLFELTFDDHRRIGEALKQMKARLQRKVVPLGHRVASHWAGSTLSDAAAIAESWSGVSMLHRVTECSRGFQREPAALIQKLERIRDFLIQTSAVHTSFTGTSSLATGTERWMKELLAATVSETGGGSRERRSFQYADGRRDGLQATADVSYCAACLPAPTLDHPDSVPLGVFAQLLSFDVLWEEIRAKGGAYGAQAYYDPGHALFAMSSYRDPAPVTTLQTFQNLRALVEGAEWSRRDVERAVIACDKRNHQPVRPGSATLQSLWRYLTGMTDAFRAARREQLLAVREEDIRATASRLLGDALARRNVCVLGSRPVLEQVRAEQGHELKITEVLPPDEQDAADE